MDPARLAPGLNLFAGRELTYPRAALARVAGTRFELVSSVAWRTASDWRILPRTCPDCLLFVPLSGSVDLVRDDCAHRLSPGQVGVIPTMAKHAAGHARGTRTWEVIALHCHARDAVGSDLFRAFSSPVLTLPGHVQWLARLVDLTALTARDPDAGRALAGALLPMLVCDLLAAGAPWQEPGAPDPRIAAALRALHADVRARRPMTEMARLSGLSPARFRVVFRAATGQSPKRYQDRLRLSEAARRLRGSADPVRAIADDLGFANDHHFHHRFRLAYGCTPSQWRAQEAWTHT